MKYKLPKQRKPLEPITNIIKAIRKTTLGGSPHPKKIKKKIPYQTLTLIANQVTQIRKIFKEEDTCFAAHPLYNLSIPDVSCDNDCLTEPEQITEAQESVHSNIREALIEIKASKNNIINFTRYEPYRAIKEKRHRIL